MLIDILELKIEENIIPHEYIKDFFVRSSRIERPETLELTLVKKLERFKELFKKKNKISLSVCYKDRYPLTKLFEGVISEPNIEQDSIKLKCEEEKEKTKKKSRKRKRRRRKKITAGYKEKS